MTRTVRPLQEYLVPHSVETALASIQQTIGRTEILSLYRHFFLDEYGVSYSSCVPATSHAYSARELEFVRLANSHLFPLDIQQFTRADKRFETIPIEFRGVYQESLEIGPMVTVGWNCLLLLQYHIMESLDWDEWEDGVTALLQHWCGDEAANHLGPAFAHITKDPVNWTRFQQSCTQAGMPLSAIPLAIDFLSNHIDNVFFFDDGDADEDQTDVLTWSVDSCKKVRGDYRQMMEMETQMDTLTDWLEASPKHVEEVITIWNASR